MLIVRVREILTDDAVQRQIAEVIDDDGNVLGQLPCTEIDYELRPYKPGVLRLELTVRRAVVVGAVTPSPLVD